MKTQEIQPETAQESYTNFLLLPFSVVGENGHNMVR